MRKLLHLTLLLMFAWLQTYQLCDASEDMIEALPASTQIATVNRIFLSKSTIPNDDADDQIPQVFEQTHIQKNVSLAIPLMSSWTLSSHEDILMAAVIHLPAPQDLSPPGQYVSHSTNIGHSNQRFVRSVQSLAPPFA